MNAIIQKIEELAANYSTKKQNTQTAIELVRYYATIVKAPFNSDPNPYKAAAGNNPNLVEFKNIDLYSNNAGTVVQIQGATGVVKIYDDKGSLLLIGTATNEITEFNIKHLKKGLYFIEANKTFFEFVK